MKKMMMAAAAMGMTGLLAGCGSSGSAPDGSGSARIVDLTTEYATTLTPAPLYAGCDTITNQSNVTRKNSTQVVVEFFAAGSIRSVDVQLKGKSTSNNDNNFKESVSISDVKKLANGNYRVVFDANSATGALLPNSLTSQGIVVTPVTEDPRPVKLVTGQNKLNGGFFVDLVVYTESSQIPLTSEFLRVVPVYTSCMLQNVAQPLNQ